MWKVVVVGLACQVWLCEAAKTDCARGLFFVLRDEAVVEREGALPDKLGNVMASCEVEQHVTKRMLERAAEATGNLDTVRRNWIAAYNSAVTDCKGNERMQDALRAVKAELTREIPTEYDGAELRRYAIVNMNANTREMYKTRGLSTDNRCMIRWDHVPAYVCKKHLAFQRRLLQLLEAA